MPEQTVGVRMQAMSPQEQVLLLARIAEARSTTGYFTPRDIESLYRDFTLPLPPRVRNVVAALGKRNLMASGPKKGQWRRTPTGRRASEELLSAMDLAALAAESANPESPTLGSAHHSVIPPVFAPASLLPVLRRFLSDHPFETNVFGMTRFPDEDDRDPDPVAPALVVARQVCQQHGLEFHLASDRAMDDDLWTNVAAHMWASRYGIAIFEDRRTRGMNYNLTIEVGGMLLSGRRCALLKDHSIAKMPTDLVGRIYKDIDLDDLSSIGTALHTWIRDDLGLGPCEQCAGGT